MDFDFQQFFTKLWMHELRQILLNPYRIYGLSGSLSPLGCKFVPRFVINKKGCTQLAIVHDKVCQLPAQGRRFPPGTPASSATKTDRHDIAEILLKVVLNPIQSINQSNITLLGTDSFISVISA
jgi:hypothetical protein